MKKHILEYKEATKKIFQDFNCPEIYFIKDVQGNKWSIKEENGIYFLSYWKDEGNKYKSIIVKKDGNPLIYKTKEYTMIIAVECIKIALIFKNKEKL